MIQIQTLAGLTGCFALVGGAAGELVSFQNTNPALDSLSYFQIGNGYSALGQSLNVTRGAFDQPEVGELPIGSFLMVWFEARDDVAGDWIYMGPGRNTHVGQADEMIDVIDPYTLHPVGHLAPGDFDDGEMIGADTNWALSWVTMHTTVSTGPAECIHFVDESFTLGLRFVMDDGVHYGFAEMTRTGHVVGEPRSVGYRPVRWGYETTAGVAVPGVGSFVVLLGGVGLVRRRR